MYMCDNYTHMRTHTWAHTYTEYIRRYYLDKLREVLSYILYLICGHHSDYHVCSQLQCISESRLQEEFNHVVEEFSLMDTNGSCFQHINDSDDITDDDTNCSLVYSICRDLILETHLTTEACLARNTSTSGHDDDEEGSDDGDMSDAEC